MKADDPRLVDEIAFAGQHSAFTGREILGRVKAERNRIWPRADVHALVFRRQSVRCVLDEDEVVPPRDLSQVVELGRVAGVVHGDDRSGASAHRFLHECGVDVERVGLDVDHDGSSAYVLDDVHRCRERHRSRNHFIACTHSGCDQCRVQSGSAGIEWQRVYGAEVLRELSSELAGFWAGRDPFRPQRVYDRRDLLLTDDRRREREESLPVAGWSPRRREIEFSLPDAGNLFFYRPDFDRCRHKPSCRLQRLRTRLEQPVSGKGSAPPVLAAESDSTRFKSLSNKDLHDRERRYHRREV